MAAPRVGREREVPSAKREDDQVLCAGKRKDGDAALVRCIHLPLTPLALAPDLLHQLRGPDSGASS